MIPFIDSIAYVHSLKEEALIPARRPSRRCGLERRLRPWRGDGAELTRASGAPQDNVTLHLDGVLYLRVEDAKKASYGVEDPEYAVAQLAQTTMRSEIGKVRRWRARACDDGCYCMAPDRLCTVRADDAGRRVPRAGVAEPADCRGDQPREPAVGRCLPSLRDSRHRGACCRPALEAAPCRDAHTRDPLARQLLRPSSRRCRCRWLRSAEARCHSGEVRRGEARRGLRSLPHTYARDRGVQRGPARCGHQRGRG